MQQAVHRQNELSNFSFIVIVITSDSIFSFECVLEFTVENAEARVM